MKKVADKLRRLREKKGWSREKAVGFFRDHGYDFSTKSLQNWENDDREPRDVDLIELINLLETQTESGNSKPSKGTSPIQAPGQRHVRHFGPAAAGDGHELEPRGHVQMTEGEYRVKFGSRTEDQVGLFQVVGDSAAPVYFAGEDVPVEVKGGTQEFREDTVYVFRYRRDVMIKRLRTLEEKGPDKKVRAESLNPGIDNRVLRVHETNFEILGLVLDTTKQQLYTSLINRFLRREGGELPS